MKRKLSQGYLTLNLDRYVIFFLIISLTKISFATNLMQQHVSQTLLTTSLGLLFILASFAFLLTGKRRIVFLYIMNIFLSLLLFADSLYFKYYGVPMSVYTYSMVSNLNGLQGSVLYLLEPKYLLLFLDLPVLTFMTFRPLKGKLIYEHNKILFAAVFLVGILLSAYVPFNSFYVNNSNPFRRFDSIGILDTFGPLGYHSLDVFYSLGNKKDLSSEDIEGIESWFTTKKNSTSLNDDNHKAIGKNKNLIVIQVESLQNFVINQTVNGQEITPNLNRLLKNSLYFPRFYPQTIEGNSSDAELLVNTSLYPLPKGSVFFRFPYNEYNSLGKLLKKEGYGTIAFHGDEGTFWNRNQMYPSLGFDQFKDIKSFNLDENIGMGLGDMSMFRQSLEILKEAEQPFYSFFVTLSNHVPYSIPEKDKKLKLPPELEESYLGDYFQSVRYTDEAIGFFIRELKKEGILKNSIIVIYGDHDGIFSKDRPLVEKWLGESINDEQWLLNYTPVPFLIYNPELKGEKRLTMGGEIDGLPTLAYVMGIDETEFKDSAMGDNLLTKKKGGVIIPSGDYITREAYLSEGKVHPYLTEEQKRTLFISDLIIRGNYFNLKKKI